MDVLSSLNKSNGTNNTGDTVPGRLTIGTVAGGAVMILLTLSALVGNLLVLTIFAKVPRLRSLSHMFVINLCSVDLFGTLLLLPMVIQSFILDGWLLGTTMCHIYDFLRSFFPFTSILSLCLIAGDRFYFIRSPMHYQGNMTPSRVAAPIAIIWLTSTAFSAFPFLGWTTYNIQSGTESCCPTNGSQHIYIVVGFVLCFLTPGCLLTVLYGVIFQVARKASRRVFPVCIPMAGTSEQRHAEERKTEGCNKIQMVDQGELCKRRTRSQLKAAKTLGLLMGLYLLLWGPHYTVNLCGAIYDMKLVPTLELISEWMGFVSFAANPLLYGWMNCAIREEILKLFTHRRFCRFKMVVQRSEIVPEDVIGSQEDVFQFLKRTSLPES